MYGQETYVIVQIVQASKGPKFLRTDQLPFIFHKFFKTFKQHLIALWMMATAVAVP